MTSQSLNCFFPQNRGPCFSAKFPQYFGRTVRNQNIALLAKWAVQTQDNIITYVRKGRQTNENRGKQCKIHGKYRTVANMQSKSKVYIYLGHLQTWVPPPRVWKIGILQEMSRNSIIPDIDRDSIPENLLSYHTRQTSLLKGTHTITDVQMHIIPVIAIRRFKFFFDVLVQNSLLILFQPFQYGLLQ